MHQGCQVPFHTSRRNLGLLLRHCWARASSSADGAPTCFFSSCGGILNLQRGIQVSSCVGPGKSNLPFELQVRAGDCSRVTAGQNRAHLGLCPGASFSFQGRQGSRGCIPDSPGESGLVSKGMNGLCSPLESRRVSLGAQEWPEWSQASCGVWREDSGLLSRPFRKRRPSSGDDGGISWVFSRCSAWLGFLTR